MVQAAGCDRGGVVGNYVADYLRYPLLGLGKFQI